VDGRYFAFTFGHVSQYLKETAYEHDFGFVVTLNSSDRDGFVSADTTEPGPARRKRVQLTSAGKLDGLGYDGESEIMDVVVAKTRPEHSDHFASATGSAALRTALRAKPEELADSCRKFLQLYGSDEYKTNYQSTQNIRPISDPAVTQVLFEKLVEALTQKAESCKLSIPEVIDYQGNTCCVFSKGGKRSGVEAEIDISRLFEFFGQHGFPTSEAELSEFRVALTDADGNETKSFSMHRSLAFDAEMAGKNYHFCSGRWYLIDPDYLAEVKRYVDSKFEACTLPDYNHDVEKDGKPCYSEGSYNEAVAAGDNNFLCLDEANISTRGHTQIEPCDLYSVAVNDESVLYHIKISTDSSKLSHLLAQGTTSIDLLVSADDFHAEMAKVLSDRAKGRDPAPFLEALKKKNFKVVFGIVTRKDVTAKSSNLPLFSQINMMKALRTLDRSRVPCAYTYIRDASPAKASQSQRKSYLVEVFQDGKKRKVRAVQGQGLDHTKEVLRCPKALTSSAVGSRFKIEIDENDDGSLYSHHSWPHETVQ